MANINEITLKELSTMYKNKTVSVKEVVQEYIKEIEAIDSGTNGLNSVLELNPDAITIAEELDDRHTERGSMLYGVPVLLKDNICTADKMHTSAGSLALADSIASADAELVKTLRKKGAVILGKTNMTEFANYMTTGMPAGYSSRGGQVKSPYKPGEDPSGSSTGSAVAVTANLCTISIGTDTSNSIVSPAIKNGIVGLRPSMGAISQKGIIPISFTCDTAGPMTRTIDDAASFFSEVTGFSMEAEETEFSNYTIGINELSLKNLKQEEVKKAEIVIKDLEKAGVTIKRLNIEPIPTENIKAIQKYEFKFTMGRYLADLPKDYPMKSVKDIINFNNEHPQETLQYGQTLLIDAQENTRGDLSEEEYITLLKDRETKKKEIFETLRGINMCLMFQENLLLQYVGLPILAIPHGLYNDGMPFGYIATSLTDVDLLKTAKSLSKMIERRVPPKL
ncbi:hypothetical protein I5677_02835 [Mobilitalea sibirica]|uniref:Amidase domain-containing protein n=1 Tax=Mobilitalea sibirica TaxID=1462919 RepID=A0A8J7HC41_9FIRM|nr:amidase family protein [Mobilitalea sibirica]MBH1939829.1 hypothetical protein [Mobilitalea sibirica]